MEKSKFTSLRVFRVDQTFTGVAHDERLRKPIPGVSAKLVLDEILTAHPDWAGFMSLEHIIFVGFRQIAPEICTLGDGLKYHVLKENSEVLQWDFGYDHCRMSIKAPENPAEHDYL